MPSNISCATLAPESLGLQILLARDPDQDLTYDDTTEDMLERSGYGGHQKPPGWRPFVWIVLLLVFAGGLYVAMQPGVVLDLFKTPERETAMQPPQLASEGPNRQSIGSTRATGDSRPISDIPTPRFHEGQAVTFAPQKADSSTPSLRGNSSGTRPGPPVQAGEPLTVLDGSLVDGTWIYQVRTTRGTTGWVSEKRLQTHS